MLSFFPTPYTDELLYSIIARYHIRSGNTSPKQTIEELFNSRTVAAVIDLPSNITRLINNMPINSEYTEEELISKHTLYQFYTAFLPSSRAGMIFESMKSHNGGDIHMRAGIMASTIAPPSHFLFCPECLKEDIERYGETYWHRIHQIPGVLICPTHKILLQRSLVSVHGENKHEFFPASEKNCIDNSSDLYSVDVTENLFTLSKDIEYLLNKNIERKEFEWFRRHYVSKLIEMDLATAKGRVRQRELIDGFRNFYGAEVLAIVQSDINYDEENNWLSSLVRKPKKSTHPIRHLLFLRYLGISLEEIFERKYEYKPFGSGPWICLNAAAEHYKKAVVQNLDITYDAKIKKAIGTFSCSCGFVYSRQGPDITEEDKYRIGRIKIFGPVWEDRLKTLVNEKKLSLRQIAKQLNVSAKTVNKYSHRLGLNLYWKSSKESKEKVVSGRLVSASIDIEQESKLEKNRKEWIVLMNKYPNKSKTEIRQLCKATYTWLYRNDRRWLDNNSPIIKVVVSNKNRVDWDKRDSDILIKVNEAVNKLLSSDNKPERISRIGKMLGILSLLEKHLDKMPKTKRYLESVVENKTDFQIRRIRWAARELEREGQEIKEWKVIRKANIREEYVEELSDILKQEVGKYL